MEIRDYSELGFSNNFMFGKLMENPDRCKRFLEQILRFKINKIEYLEREKTVDGKYDGRGIRLDIYASDNNVIYNCEMQTTNERNLPKRSRYYQSKIDASTLKRGVDFNKLSKAYIIFICTFDPFNLNNYCYKFENRCESANDLLLGDESIKIFINTQGTTGNVTEEFKELLRFIESSEDRHYNNELANDLLSDLKKARSNEEWRHDYMTWRDYGNECEAKGRAEGRAEARAEDIENMLLRGKTPEEIADFCGYTLEEVNVIAEKLSSIV